MRHFDSIVTIVNCVPKMALRLSLRSASLDNEGVWVLDQVVLLVATQPIDKFDEIMSDYGGSPPRTLGQGICMLVVECGDLHISP